MLVDREAVKKVIYGRAGRVTANFLNGPEQFVSKNTTWEFSIEKASKLLEDAGWKAGADGIREKDGKKLKLLYQTAINGPRQKTQAIVKQACQKAGIDVELKSVVASVFFSSDVANPDTYAKFYADLEMFQIPMSQPDPAQHMRRYHSRYVATKENKWQGVNFPRWVNKDYDAAIDAAETETDPVKRAALYIKANDIMMAGHRVHPGDAPPEGGSGRQYAAPGGQRLGQRNRQSVRLVPGGDGIIATGFFPHEPVCAASSPDRGPEPARHLARSVHRAGAGARRSLQ